MKLRRKLGLIFCARYMDIFTQPLGQMYDLSFQFLIAISGCAYTLSDLICVIIFSNWAHKGHLIFLPPVWLLLFPLYNRSFVNVSNSIALRRYIWSRFDSGSDIAEPGPMFPFNQIPNQFASKGSALSVPHHLLHIFSCQCLLHFVWDFILEILGVFMNRLFGDVWPQSDL